MRLPGKGAKRKVSELVKPGKLKEIVDALEYPETWQV